jgi:Tol biopolymer transport system component
MSSPLLALRTANTTTIAYGFLLIGGIIIVLSSIFIVPLNQSAYGGTFPGPNGLIAFSSYRDGNFDIYVMNAADGSGQTRLPPSTTTANFSPSWSPDGEKIAFVGKTDNLPEEIYVMNADDGSGQT